jgi:hypothetical protein
MKINQLAAKPQLIKLVIKDEDTIKEFGEEIEFWTWDRQPLDVFMKLATINQNDPKQIIEIMRSLILDEKGNKVIEGDMMLPTKVLIKMIQIVVESLGKF